MGGIGLGQWPGASGRADRSALKHRPCGTGVVVGRIMVRWLLAASMWFSMRRQHGSILKRPHDGTWKAVFNRRKDGTASF